jgi:hypothetical protein
MADHGQPPSEVPSEELHYLIVSAGRDHKGVKAPWGAAERLFGSWPRVFAPHRGGGARPGRVKRRGRIGPSGRHGCIPVLSLAAPCMAGDTSRRLHWCPDRFLTQAVGGRCASGMQRCNFHLHPTVRAPRATSPCGPGRDGSSTGTPVWGVHTPRRPGGGPEPIPGNGSASALARGLSGVGRGSSQAQRQASDKHSLVGVPRFRALSPT